MLLRPSSLALLVTLAATACSSPDRDETPAAEQPLSTTPTCTLTYAAREGASTTIPVPGVREGEIVHFNATITEEGIRATFHAAFIATSSYWALQYVPDASRPQGSGMDTTGKALLYAWGDGTLTLRSFMAQCV